jgi:hypothetical protein
MNLLQGLHRHHIIPRYRGGSDAPENLVLLHPIDHAIAHLVRFKIYGNPGDGWAYNRIINGLKDELIPNRKGIPKPYMRKPKSEETKAKMSAAAKGRKKSPEAVEKMRIALAGRKATGKSLEALHAHRHLAWTPEAQAKKSQKTKGVSRPWAKNVKPPSLEACASGGKAGKGRKQTPEQVAKRVAARRATLAAQGRTV